MDEASAEQKPAVERLPTLEELERVTILERLGVLANNRTYTARSLGISIRTLRNKLALYRMNGVDVPAGDPGIRPCKQCGPSASS